MSVKRIVGNVLSKVVPVSSKVIAFESLNDFDCNSGALYDYMIENHLNEKYKIIWLVKNKENLTKLDVKNVKCVDFNNRSFKDKIMLRRAKYLFWDNVPIEKYSNKQKSIYLTHGFPAIKNVKGIINVPEDCDYFLATSKKMTNHAIEQFSIQDSTEIIYAGLPRTDYLKEKKEEIKKIVDKDFNKIIIWMPTFRKAKNSDRSDSDKEFKLGIPLIQTEKDFERINNELKKNNDLLILKIHGGQDKSVLKLKDMSNIKIITVDDEKRLKIHLYKLIACTDALLTDYSSVSFDYFLMNKPIGYIIDDIKEYKLGFAFDSVYDYMPGSLINNTNDLIKFIKDVSAGKDENKKQRNKVLKEINEYQDFDNRERILNYFNIK